MTPSKLRTWLKRIPAGAQSVQLAIDGITGMTEVANWERSEVEDLDADEDADVASQILTQAQEWVDGEREPGKFQIRWMSEKGKALRVATHRAIPTAIEDVEGEEDAGTGGAPDDLKTQMLALIRDLGRRDTEKDKQMVKVLTTSSAAYGNTITMLTTQLKSAYAQLAEKHGVSSAAAVPVELTEEQREEVIQRARAMEAFSGKIPDVMDLILAVLAERYLPDPNAPKGTTEDKTTEH